MSDEEDISSTSKRRTSNQSGTAGRGSGSVVTGGAGSGARKADNPSAWIRVPTSRSDASGRPRSTKNGR